MSVQPNPGSSEALSAGCRCAVIDNHYGKGVPYPRDDGKDPERFPSFWINADCPIHASSAAVSGRTNNPGDGDTA